MQEDIFIRQATIADAEIIAGFNSAMAAETEDKKLNNEIINSGVRNLFHHPEYGFYIVAECQNQVVACLLITYEWSDWRDGLIWWIQSVYVHPNFRRLGIYSRMYDHIRKLAIAKLNIRGIRLYVEKENDVAQKTYCRLGMSETVYKMFEEMFE